MPKKESPWWKKLFDEDFRPFFFDKSQKNNNLETNYFIKKLKLKKGMSFLDCPCGIGRISIPMAKKGIKVTGIDITQPFLDELDNEIARQKLPIKTKLMDMRHIDYENQFDAAGNLWTSLGYFEKESDNQKVLNKIFKALKPGGRFAIQIINRDWIITNFTSSDWREQKGIRLLEQRSFDYEKSTIRSTWTFIKGASEKSLKVSLRMYSYHELIGMLSKAGFEKIEGFGTIKDEPISRDHMEQIIFAVKPK